MTFNGQFRSILKASAAALVLAACAETEIASPGDFAPPPPPPPPPPTAPVSTIDLVPAAGCPVGTIELTLPEEGPLSDVSACAIQDTITTDLTLTSDIVFAINGPTFVGAGVTLTIEPGTTLFGSSGADFLAVAQGGELQAVGTVTDPIIFTAREDVNDMELGTSLATEFTRGEWGGLIINGFAPINACDDPSAVGGTAECTADGEGGTGTFGGDQPDDSSGSIQFIQVRFAGFEITPSNELNGIAFQGVGSGTTVNNIQVFNNDDDGVEFFGGTVDAMFVALNGNDDDSLDWTDGWTGNVQFLLIEHAIDAGDQGIEADTNGEDPVALPTSNPVISNVTIIGFEDGPSDIGMLFQAGTAGTIVNGVVTGGFDDGALDVDDAATFANIGDTDGTALTVESFILDEDTPFIIEADDPVDISVEFGEDDNVFTIDATLQAEFFPGPNEFSVETFDVEALDPFFDPPTVIGAFRDFDTPLDNWATGWTFMLVEDPADVVIECPVGTEEVAVVGLEDEVVCELPPLILGDLTLEPGPLYQISGPTLVGEDQGPDPDNPILGTDSGALTISGGVTLFGSTGGDFLSISRGSQIFSNGLSDNPVVFTSLSDVLGEATVATNGEWGGLILNGRAPINACDDITALGGTIDCEADGEGGSGTFGGATPDDDSGNLFFTQVRFAGFEITPSNELNGIAFQAVGSETEVDSIQVHNNDDDGVEFFGGTVGVKNVLLTGNADDSIDWTDGWTGSLQFGVVQHSAIFGDQGIEADNNGEDPIATPVSMPTISNVSLLAQDTTDFGVLFQAGTGANLVNAIIVNFFDGGIDVDDGATFDNVQGIGLAPLTVESVFLDNSGPDFVVEAGDPVDISTVFTENVVTGDADLSGTTFVFGAPGIVPGPVIGAVTPVDPITLGLEAGSFLGAVSGADDDTFDGWTFNETLVFDPPTTTVAAVE